MVWTSAERDGIDKQSVSSDLKNKMEHSRFSLQNLYRLCIILTFSFQTLLVNQLQFHQSGWLLMTIEYILLLRLGKQGTYLIHLWHVLNLWKTSNKRTSQHHSVTISSNNLIRSSVTCVTAALPKRLVDNHVWGKWFFLECVDNGWLVDQFLVIYERLCRLWSQESIVETTMPNRENTKVRMSG